MLSAEEKKAALRALSFNWRKALRLFCFCLASFSVGLCALYWWLDYRYAERLSSLQEQMVHDIAIAKLDNQPHAQADIYQGVVRMVGRADFDNVTVLGDEVSSYPRSVKLVKVKGEKRAIAPGIYQIRFVERTAANKKAKVTAETALPLVKPAATSP